MKSLVKKVKTQKTLPILENILVKDGVATVDNRETRLTFKTKLEDGFYSKSYFEKGLEVPVKGDITEFVSGVRIENPKKFTLTQAQIGLLMKATKACGNDDLRPVMKGVFLDSQGCAATDAHRMVFHKFECGVDTI